MKPLTCEYCGEHYTCWLDEDAEDVWEPECDCVERERKREIAEDAYWDRKIDEARGK